MFLKFLRGTYSQAVPLAVQLVSGSICFSIIFFACYLFGFISSFVRFLRGCIQCRTQSIFGDTVYWCYCKFRLVTPAQCMIKAVLSFRIVYDVLTGEIVTKLKGHHKQCVRDVSWHPYENIIMSSSVSIMLLFDVKELI